MSTQTRDQARARHLRAALYALGTTAVVLLSDRSILQDDLRVGYTITALAFVLAFAFWQVMLTVFPRLWAPREDDQDPPR